MNDLIDRSKWFGINVWKYCSKIPKSREYDSYVRQLLRCSSSVGANYRAAQRAKSKDDFIYKIKIVLEEADESMFFLEVLLEICPNLKDETKLLHKEAEELTKIFRAILTKSKK